jgi:xanthine/uracil/vitamin C permease (AzgA family)
VSDEIDRKRVIRLFDIRRIIGGLFLLYGVILTVVGILDGQAAVDKAQGVRINLWTGIAMIVVGAIFLVWERLRPLDAPDPSHSGETDEPE